MDKIAVTHPGKLGDAIYSLLAIRWLCEKHKKKADFWTSNYCKPLKRLFEYQSCIEGFYVSPSYRGQHMRMGVQPWYVPVTKPNDYEAVYHLGFRSAPTTYIPFHICETVSAPRLQVYYEYPDIHTLDEDYIVVAPRKENQWKKLIETLSKKCKVVQIGAFGDKVSDCGIDKTGLDFLETTAWISKSKAFMGCKSSQLVLAEGFPIPKFDKPSSEKDINIPTLNCYNKCFDLNDYRWLREAIPHIDQIAMLGFPYHAIDHFDRRWEYGMSIHLIRHSGRTLLNVGDSKSLFAFAASWVGKKVTVVDVTQADNQAIIDAQNVKLAKLRIDPIVYDKTDFMKLPDDLIFDNVTSINVIQHVRNNEKFFQKLCKHVKVGGLLFLTMDFVDSWWGKNTNTSENEIDWWKTNTNSTEHKMTYSEEDINELISYALSSGFKIYGTPSNYSNVNPRHKCACICLKRHN